FSISGALPPGLFVSNNAIQGVPTTAGPFSFNLVLGNQSLGCSIAINPNPITVTGGCPLPLGSVGVDYSRTIVASGGTGPYNIFSSGLPAGLTITPTAVPTGSPANSAAFLLS